MKCTASIYTSYCADIVGSDEFFQSGSPCKRGRAVFLFFFLCLWECGIVKEISMCLEKTCTLKTFFYSCGHPMIMPIKNFSTKLFFDSVYPD